MSDLRYFHGKIDATRFSFGQWQTVNQERRYAHSIEQSRQIFYEFSTHTHPYAQRMISEIVNHDLDGLLAMDNDPALRVDDFTERYQPAEVVPERDPDLLHDHSVGVFATPRPVPEGDAPDPGLPVREIDFDYQYGAYAAYNWELFFHVPFLVATHLSANGRYSDAQSWFHQIFDPTDSSDPAAGPSRFWRLRPFQLEQVTHVEDLLSNLATGGDPQEQRSTVRAIEAWRDQPLRPHLIARTRPTAYMYATVMAYLDNLLAWGDSLFQQDTRESINEATELYVLAANILGPRPQPIPQVGRSAVMTYQQLKTKLDGFSNASVDLEPEIGFDLYPPTNVQSAAPPQHAVIASINRGLYFCIPRNEKIDGYHTTLADRFWKIHTSRTLQGVFRQLPLFPPPIDPALLARAVTAGVDVGSIIDGSALGPAPVRFAVLLQKSLEMAAEVKAFGAQLLSAIEKKDGETLGVLRARHESSTAEFNEGLKFAQWQEAIKAREGVWLNIATAFERFRHYERLLGIEAAVIRLPDYAALDTNALDARRATGEEPVIQATDPEVRIGGSFRDGGHKINPEEAHEIDLQEAAQILQDVATGLDIAGAVLNLIPATGAKASPFGVGAEIVFGGENISGLLRDLGTASRGVASRVSHEAMLAGKMAGFARREQEWAIQRKTSATELTALFKQFRAAEIREYVAKTDHDNARKQIEFAQDIVEFLTNERGARTGGGRKTTTEDFYLWMKRETHTLYGRSFEIAFDLARSAERAAAFELPQMTDTFLGSTYLAGRERLLAGEKLYLDLKRLEFAYLEANRREFELVKHVSMKEWFPLELLELRTTGRCEISITEAMFDLDCPGHSFRRIKSVAVSIPCVVGPYASVNCQLALTSSIVRTGAGGYYTSPGHGYDPASDAANFREYTSAVQSTVTSGAQSDAGVFDTNARDERYLPFEYAGAISTWSIELLGSPPAFDYDSIADLVLTIRYTARAGGSRPAATTGAQKWLDEHAARSFSLRHEFATAWAAFKHAPAGAPATLSISLDESRYPYRLRDSGARAHRLHLVFTGDPGGTITARRADTALGTLNGLSPATLETDFVRTGEFELTFASNEIDDLWLVVDQSAS